MNVCMFSGHWSQQLTMSWNEKLNCLTLISIPFKAIGINSGNAADGYSRYQAIGGWWHLPLLQLQLVSHRQHHQYLKHPGWTQALLDITFMRSTLTLKWCWWHWCYLEVDAERVKIVRPCELRRHHSEDSLLSVSLLGDWDLRPEHGLSALDLLPAAAAADDCSLHLNLVSLWCLPSSCWLTSRAGFCPTGATTTFGSCQNWLGLTQTHSSSKLSAPRSLTDCCVSVRWRGGKCLESNGGIAYQKWKPAVRMRYMAPHPSCRAASGPTWNKWTFLDQIEVGSGRRSLLTVFCKPDISVAQFWVVNRLLRRCNRELCGAVWCAPAALWEVTWPEFWSRDQILVTWPNKRLPGDAGSPARRTTRSDQGHAAGREGQIKTQRTYEPSAHQSHCHRRPENTFATRASRIPSDCFVHVERSVGVRPSLASVEKRNFATRAAAAAANQRQPSLSCLPTMAGSGKSLQLWTSGRKEASGWLDGASNTQDMDCWYVLLQNHVRPPFPCKLVETGSCC